VSAHSSTCHCTLCLQTKTLKRTGASRPQLSIQARHDACKLVGDAPYDPLRQHVRERVVAQAAIDSALPAAAAARVAGAAATATRTGRAAAAAAPLRLLSPAPASCTRGMTVNVLSPGRGQVLVGLASDM